MRCTQMNLALFPLLSSIQRVEFTFWGYKLDWEGIYFQVFILRRSFPFLFFFQALKMAMI